MTRILLYLIIALLLFSAGLGASWFLIHQQQTAPLAAAGKDGERSDNLREKVPGDAQAPLAAPADGPAEDLPVPLRSRPLTAEEVFRFGATFRNQQAALEQRAADLQQEQARLQLVHEDIRGSRLEADGMLKQIEDSMNMAERLLAQLQSERTQLDQERQRAENQLDEFQQSQIEYETAESNNLKKISGWLESMPTEKAAAYLRELSNDGKIESAIKLLGDIEDRNAAKILAAMDDPALIVQLTEAFRHRKPPEKKGTRRR